MFSIKLLGGWSVEGDVEGLGASISHRHQRALLALLAVRLARPVSREKLCALLWPERDEVHARGLLNQAVHSLRKAMGEGAIFSSGDELRLDPALVRSDVDEFERALEAGDSEGAVALYAGPFLDGFFLPNAGELDRWVEGERARLRRRYMEGLEQLAERSTAGGDAQQALRWWQRLVAEDPFSARLTLGLMEALERAGDRAGAIRQASEHARLLEEELEAEPNPEVVELAERMRREPMTRPPLPPGRALVKPPAMRAAASGMPEADVRRPDTKGDGRSRFLRWGMAAGMGGAVLVAGWFGFLHRPASHLDPRRVVVAPLENHTGHPHLDPLGSYVADWIIQGLSRTGAHVVTSSATQAALRDLRETAGHDSIVSVGRLARETGAALVVSGRFYSEGDSLRFHVEIADARGEPVLSAVAVSAPEALPYGAAETLRQRVAGALALALNEQLSVVTQNAQTPQPPPSYDAYVEYANGMDLFFDRRWGDAIPYFHRAMELDTGYLAPKLDLAWVYVNRGEWDVADTLLRSLDGARHRMAPVSQAALDLMRANLRQDPVGEYSAAKRAAELAPGTLPNVQWAREALDIGRPAEAIEILSALDPTRRGLRRWDAYWDWLTTAYHMLGKHRKELDEARRARKIQPDNPRIYLCEARALAALGRVQRVDAVVDEGIRQPFRDSALDAGVFIMVVADELHAHGQEQAALSMFRRALLWYQSRPPEDPRRESLWRVRALLRTGRLDEADSVLTLFRSRRPQSLWGGGLDGILASLRGDRARAEKALAFLASLDDPYLLRGERLMLEANITARLGRKREAVALMRQAFSEGLEYGIEVHSQDLLDPLADDPAFQELMRPQGD